MIAPSGVQTWTRDDGCTITTDPARLDVAVIHGYLTRSYWAEGIPEAVVRRALAHSLGFGVFDGTAQVGFARVVTDFTTYAWLGDVFVLESHRGRGLGAWLMTSVMSHPDLQGLRRFTLATRDAHELYRRFGFTAPARPQSLMEVFRPDVYAAAKENA